MSFLLTGDLNDFEALCAAARDDRPHPERDALEQLGLALMTETLDVIGDTALEDHVTPIAEGLIGAFHSISLRLQRDWDRAADDVKRLSRDFDGSEIADVELQNATAKAHAAHAAIQAVEMIRDRAAETYTAHTGEVWAPWRGSIRRSTATAAQIDGREALRVKRIQAMEGAAVGGHVVAVRGSPSANTRTDANRLYDALNWARAQWPDMQLATTKCPGVEQLAMNWARDHHVDHIRVPFDKAKHDRAAGFRANDAMMDLEPVLVLTLSHSLDPVRAAETEPFGIALNAAKRAQSMGIPHLEIRLRKAA